MVDAKVFGKALDPSSSDYKEFQPFINALEQDFQVRAHPNEDNYNLDMGDIEESLAVGLIRATEAPDGSLYMTDFDIGYLMTQGPGRPFLKKPEENSDATNPLFQRIVRFFDFLKFNFLKFLESFGPLDPHHLKLKNLPVYKKKPPVAQTIATNEKNGSPSELQRFYTTIQNAIDQTVQASRDGSINVNEVPAADATTANYAKLALMMAQALAGPMGQELGVTTDDIVAAADFLAYVKKTRQDLLFCMTLDSTSAQDITENIDPQVYGEFTKLYHSLVQTDPYAGGNAADLLLAALQWNRGLCDVAEEAKKKQCPVTSP